MRFRQIGFELQRMMPTKHSPGVTSPAVLGPTMRVPWLYGQQNQVRPMMPANATQEELTLASRAFDLAPQLPQVDWSKALRHLPEMDIIKAVNGPKGIYADEMPVPTGGAMIKRTPNDPAWYKGGLFHDNMRNSAGCSLRRFRPI